MDKATAELRERAKLFLLRRGTLEDMNAGRALYFAAAGVNFATVLLIAQVWGAGPTALRVALLLSSIAVPVWLSLAMTVYYAIYLKVPSEAIVGVKSLRNAGVTALYAGCALTAGSIASLIWNFMPAASILFVVTLLIGIVTCIWAFRQYGGLLSAEFQDEVSAAASRKP